MPDVRFIWLGSINKWIIPRKIRRIVEKDHPSNVEFPGYFKGGLPRGHDGFRCFLLPSYEETEGIVVLEALPGSSAYGLAGYSSIQWLDRRDVHLN